MSSMIKTEPVVYTKDFGGYSTTEDNFVAGQEITVTITLNEYHKLVKASAEAEARDAERDKWEAQSKANELEKEVKHLRSIISEQSSVKAVAITKDGESVSYDE